MGVAFPATCWKYKDPLWNIRIHANTYGFMLNNWDSWWNIGFGMQNEDSWWFLMNHDESWWNITIHDESWWLMITNEDSWFTNEGAWWKGSFIPTGNQGWKRYVLRSTTNGHDEVNWKKKKYIYIYIYMYIYIYIYIYNAYVEHIGRATGRRAHKTPTHTRTSQSMQNKSKRIQTYEHTSNQIKTNITQIKTYITHISKCI